MYSLEQRRVYTYDIGQLFEIVTDDELKEKNPVVRLQYHQN